jgi:putative transposase
LSGYYSSKRPISNDRAFCFSEFAFMARLPRLTVPGYPHHIVQSGHNRQPIVLDDVDRQRLIDEMAEQARIHELVLHAYVMTDDRLQLLVTPATATGVPLLMQALGRGYVKYFNRRHARRGTLWEGRYRGSVLEAERYLLACMVHLDLYPVCADLAASPADYLWSSHMHYSGLRSEPFITPHPL